MSTLGMKVLRSFHQACHWAAPPRHLPPTAPREGGAMETQPETWRVSRPPWQATPSQEDVAAKTTGQFGGHGVERQPAAMRISPERSPSNKTASQPAKAVWGFQTETFSLPGGENCAKQLASSRPASPRPSPNRNPGLRPSSRGSLSVLSALPRPRAITSH